MKDDIDIKIAEAEHLSGDEVMGLLLRSVFKMLAMIQQIDVRVERLEKISGRSIGAVGIARGGEVTCPGRVCVDNGDGLRVHRVKDGEHIDAGEMVFLNENNEAVPWRSVK